jgi:CHAD domain-containing protein
MPGKLQRSASGTQEARRIVSEHIAAARDALKSEKLTDSSIHEARKSISRARAVWRLLRTAIPAASYRKTNAQLRDAGRPLGAARDAKILPGALDKVLKTVRGRSAIARVQRFRRALLQNGNAVKREVLMRASGVELARQILATVYPQVKRVRVGGRNWSVLGKGLKRAYRHGRRLQRAAQANRSAELLHEWRKQVKYLRHQLTFLKPLWRGPMRELADQADRLSECLGDDHDLVVLRAHVRANRETFTTARQEADILAAIEHCREQLQQAALARGALIYEEKAAQFVDRIGAYCRQWRHSSRRAD